MKLIRKVNDTSKEWDTQTVSDNFVECLRLKLIEVLVVFRAVENVY